MARPTYDAKWLFAHDRDYFGTFGTRDDVAGVVCWTNVDNPRHRDGNHAAVPEGDHLIPDQLIQIFDHQRSAGASPCVDVYGAEDPRDALVKEYGLVLEHDTPLVVVGWKRGAREPEPLPGGAPAVELEEIPRKGWTDAVLEVHGGELDEMWRNVVMLEALADAARFFGIRESGKWVSLCSRYDFDDYVQIESLFTSPAERHRGLASTVVKRALESSDADHGFWWTHRDNEDSIALARHVGAEICAENLKRRYTEKSD